MDDNLALKIAFVLVVVSTALLAGVPVLRRAPVTEAALVSHFDFGESLAAGVFLGVGLIHMLGDAALDYAEAGIVFPLSELVAGLMMLALLAVEHQGARIAARTGGRQPKPAGAARDLGASGAQLSGRRGARHLE